MRYKDSRNKSNITDATDTVSLFDILGTQSALLAHDLSHIAARFRDRRWSAAALSALETATLVHAAIEAHAIGGAQ